MGYDTLTAVTDDLSDNLAEYQNEKKTAIEHVMSASAYAAYTRTQSMTGNVTLTDSDYPIQSFSPTAARDLTLPAVATTNHAFYVVNRSGTYAITIKNSGGTTVYSLAAGQSVSLVSDGSNGWYAMVVSAVEYAGAEGTIKNGKISVSVASNNITLALKTLAGTNPTTADPVKVVIGGIERTITGSLSVTVNAGANSFNAGSAELATKEIDYFAYLSYRSASSAVVIGFSRIPYASLYSDLSGTATDEKYAAFSTAPNSSDSVVNIGRFAATHSAGAGYTWSVPTFTSKNLIQFPVFRTRRLSYASQVSASSGSITTIGTVSSTYEVQDNRFIVVPDITITNNGTGSGKIQATMPFSPTVAVEAGIGKEFAVTGKALLFSVVSANTMRIQFYDATYPGSSGARFTGYFTAFLE